VQESGETAFSLESPARGSILQSMNAEDDLDYIIKTVEKDASDIDRSR
jgi:hypothetical protein